MTNCGPSRGPGEEAVVTWEHWSCSLQCEGPIKEKRKETMEGEVGVHSRVSVPEAGAWRFPQSQTLSLSRAEHLHRLPNGMVSPPTILGARLALLIFAASSLQVPGPFTLALLLAPTGAEGLPPALPAPAVGLPGKSGQPGEGSLVGKQSWEVSQRELSADGFVISHKTGAFRFVNQSRLSRRMNVRFIGSKKALR